MASKRQGWTSWWKHVFLVPKKIKPFMYAYVFHSNSVCRPFVTEKTVFLTCISYCLSRRELSELRVFLTKTSQRAKTKKYVPSSARTEENQNIKSPKKKIPKRQWKNGIDTFYRTDLTILLKSNNTVRGRPVFPPVWSGYVLRFKRWRKRLFLTQNQNVRNDNKNRFI